MASDFLEQLADAEVPPPPASFDRQLHERVNRSLLLVQLTDLVCGALPWALWHMSQALGGLISLTVCGKFQDERKKNL